MSEVMSGPFGNQARNIYDHVASHVINKDNLPAEYVRDSLIAHFAAAMKLQDEASRKVESDTLKRLAEAEASLTFKALANANAIRASEWNPEGKELGLEFAVIELAGECGELCNALKKLLRAQHGIVGGTTDRANLIDELADVVICADLVARKLGIDLGMAVASKFNTTSRKHGFQTML